MRNRQFVFAPKIEYELAAESAERADKLREANQNSLTFPFWCSILEYCKNRLPTSQKQGNTILEMPASLFRFDYHISATVVFRQLFG